MSIGAKTVVVLGLLCLGALSPHAWPADEQIRPPAVAGSWYPGDSRELAAYVDRLLDVASGTDAGGTPVRALIVPHAGYMYSGATAAEGYRLVRGEDYSRVIVLGPAHRGHFRGLSVADVSRYQTPLGPAYLDLQAVAHLRRSGLVKADPAAHDQEHSIEMQLPFLQRALKPGWRLVPVLVGDMDDADYAVAADLLRPLMDRRTLLVVSSDFTHFGPRFGYQPFPLDGETAERLAGLDYGALDKILALDAQGLLDYQRDTGVTVCGYRPIAILLALLPPSSPGSLQAYATSGQLTGDFTNSVSYLSIVFRDVVAAASERLSLAEMRLLHEIAATAVKASAQGASPTLATRLKELLGGAPAALRVPAGVFVTLKRHGELRGCIGYMEPREPLRRAVMENGYKAAQRDYRFPPVSAEELDGLQVQVSVLTPPEPIASYREFQVGEQGIILEKDGLSAVFLPEVALEQGWDREQTLDFLARKAGLPADAWRSGARLSVFRSQKYAAPLQSNPDRGQ